ncbi:MAG: hypothetical protein OHK93_006465 [Ramalina farinacea]|uniref:Uncharacterized protein n=1 Tax=Ramalina farinacea TaxID=258253 RepID=A0AA43QLJ7_9LECA|nr:hypothetical protein [Ramalina farinacea]
MNRRARSEDLGEARIRKLEDVDRLHQLGTAKRVQSHPASMQSITEVRLWYLMQDYLLDPRAHKNIKPLQMPDNLQELFPLEDEMLDDEDLATTNWPDNTESRRLKDGYVSSEATMEEMIDDAAGDDLGPHFDYLDDELSSETMLDDDLIPSFDCLNDEPIREMMLDDDLDESGARNSEGCFEDLMSMQSFDCLNEEPSDELMLDDELVEARALSSEGFFEDLTAMPVDSRKTISIFNGIMAESWENPGETLVYKEGHGSRALTSRADSEEGLDEASSMPDSEEILDSSFSTVDNEAFAFSDALDDEEQISPRRLELEDEDDLLDP